MHGLRVSSGVWKMVTEPADMGLRTHLPNLSTQNRTVSLHFFLKHQGKTGFRKNALQPGRIPEGNDYSTTSPGSAEKRNCCFAVDKVEIKALSG